MTERLVVAMYRPPVRFGRPVQRASSVVKRLGELACIVWLKHRPVSACGTFVGSGESADLQRPGGRHIAPTSPRATAGRPQWASAVDASPRGPLGPAVNCTARMVEGLAKAADTSDSSIVESRVTVGTRIWAVTLELQASRSEQGNRHG